MSEASITAVRLDAAAVSPPVFDPAAIATDLAAAAGAPAVTPFDLTSHGRARDALSFGLAMTAPGYNIFVVGEDRSGRMTATLAYLHHQCRDSRPADDWVYLANFSRPNRPKPYRLAPGTGRRLRNRLDGLLDQAAKAMRAALTSPDHEQEVMAASREMNSGLETDVAAIQATARAGGLDVQRRQDDMAVFALGPAGERVPLDQLSPDQRAALQPAWDAVRQVMAAVSRTARQRQRAFEDRTATLRRAAAAEAVAPLVEAAGRDFTGHAGLARWFAALEADLIDQMDRILAATVGERSPQADLLQAALETRYSVRLLVDRADDTHKPVVLEPNPTRDSLIGSFEYHLVNGVLQTDFSLVRAGALHRANGGILVLRAEALARAPGAWEALKAALRDGDIRIEERTGAGGLPAAGAPRPKPIPLDVKVVLVGPPRWYYTYFSVDREFQAQFKVKADIDPDMPASPANLACYARLIDQASRRLVGRPCSAAGIAYVLGRAARWSGRRCRLSARFELIEDALVEAGACGDDGDAALTADSIRRGLDERRYRNARVEDRAQQMIQDGVVMIDTAGAEIGQVNGLAVHDGGDHSFGGPARVTARVHAGKAGVLNIERQTALGGPLQQKGVLVLEGWLNGCFAQRFPLSFSASVTFEQTYGGIDGDSASLAELLAILSALARLPLRQDLAITGSVNQLGRAQAVAGVTEKIEGFYYTCRDAGLTGSQGVAIPAASVPQVMLREDVAGAVADGRFHIWSLQSIDDAVTLFLQQPAGTMAADGSFPADTVYGAVHARLAGFDRILAERGRH